MWVQVLITSSATLLASSGLWSFIMYRTKTRKSSQKLLLGLAYEKILSDGMVYINRGWITKDEYEAYRATLYEPYANCGGNGVATRVMQEVSNLPIRNPAKLARVRRYANNHLGG